MPVSDDDPPLRRSLRAKRADRTPRRVDGGAVAAGLCLGVLGTFVAVAGPLPVGARLGVTTICLLGGTVVAGYLTTPDHRLGGWWHGLLVVVATAGLMGLVALSVVAGGDAFPIERVPLVFLADTAGRTASVGAVGLVLLSGAVAGHAGATLRRS